MYVGSQSSRGQSVWFMSSLMVLIPGQHHRLLSTLEELAVPLANMLLLGQPYTLTSL